MIEYLQNKRSSLLQKKMFCEIGVQWSNRHYDTHYNDNQYNANHHNAKQHNDIQHNDTACIMLLFWLLFILNGIYAEHCK